MQISRNHFFPLFPLLKKFFVIRKNYSFLAPICFSILARERNLRSIISIDILIDFLGLFFLVIFFSLILLLLLGDVSIVIYIKLVSFTESVFTERCLQALIDRSTVLEQSSELSGRKKFLRHSGEYDIYSLLFLLLF